MRVGFVLLLLLGPVGIGIGGGVSGWVNGLRVWLGAVCLFARVRRGRYDLDWLKRVSQANESMIVLQTTTTTTTTNTTTRGREEGEGEAAAWTKAKPSQVGIELNWIALAALFKEKPIRGGGVRIYISHSLSQVWCGVLVPCCTVRSRDLQPWLESGAWFGRFQCRAETGESLINCMIAAFLFLILLNNNNFNINCCFGFVDLFILLNCFFL